MYRSDMVGSHRLSLNVSSLQSASNAPLVRSRARRSYDYISLVPDDRESQQLPPWNTYLYRLQQEAPKPFCVACQREVPNKPEFYGNEFHGSISRSEADSLLVTDGCYLVRKSERAADAFTLAIRFNGETKNFKLYFDGQHFVGEKRFDTVYDLVADGLIHFYIELRAADYIKQLSSESTYEESPYMTYTQCRMRHDKTLRVRPLITCKPSGVNNTAGTGAGDKANEVDGENRLSQGEGMIEKSVDWSNFEKPHVFKVQNFNGLNWCELCANFMWGLIAQGVKCQDCGVQTHKKCSEKMPNDCQPDMKYIKRLYGVDLTTVSKASKQLLPVVVEKCVKEIEKRGLDQEGLYRLAGFHDDVEAIRVTFDKDGENTDISAAKYEDINTIASALKLYFRLLPIPLITFEVYKPLLDIIKKELAEIEMVRQMREVLNTSPPAHLHTLKYLTTHLVKVTENRSKTMMSAENLSIVFAPTLMRPLEANPIMSLMAAKFEQKVIEFILNHQREIFGR